LGENLAVVPGVSSADLRSNSSKRPLGAPRPVE